MMTPKPKNQPQRSIRVKWIDSLYIGVLISYVLAGCVLVPFHGDESTTLYESRDFTTFFLNGDLAHLVYRIPPPSDDPESATRQDLRVLNGVLSGDIYGFMTHLAGFTTQDLNQQWIWGADWHYNQSQGVFPKPTLLFVARWTSALLIGLSVVLIFSAGYIIQGRWAAYLAAAIYTLTPAVLLNGRRAVFEGNLLLTEALLLYVIVRMIGKRPTLKSILALGIASGLAILSKHTNALVIAAAFAGLTLFPILHRQWRPALTMIGSVIVAGVIAGAIFLAFNPSWWSNPLAMPQIVLDKRQAIIAQQADPVKSTHTLPMVQQRVSAIITESLIASPQYFESSQDWQHWIGDQIDRYAASGLAGISGAGWSIGLAVLLLFGTTFCLINWRHGPIFAILIWIVVVTVGLYILNPVDWQRYYLPMTAPIALLASQVTGFTPDYLKRLRLMRSHKALTSANNP